MNTLRAFQGVDTAFSVTLSPPSVDFPASPPLVADVHRGDGRMALATLSPTWVNTSTDTIAVPLPGTVTADMEAGNYLLSMRLADSSAYFSWDALVIYPGTAATAPIRSLIAPSDALGVIPDFKVDLHQMDGLTWLLEAATVACENYCDMTLAITEFDRITYLDRFMREDWYARRDRALELDGRPVYDFRVRENPLALLTIQGPAVASTSTASCSPTSPTNIALKTLTLRSVTSGVSASTVLMASSYATVADLAAAVTLAGWTASVASGQGARPTSDITAEGNGAVMGATSGAELFGFFDESADYRLDARNGNLELMASWHARYPAGGSHWRGRLPVRFTYRGGYAIDPADVALGVDRVPKDLQAACLMVAIAIRESARTAGPTLQQGLQGAYYTKSATETAIPTPARALLDGYGREWGVA